MPHDHNYKRKYSKQPQVKPETLDEVEQTPTMQLFRQYASELDDKHDRYERIVKISRDITIESKRIIFLLHNVGVDLDSKREQIHKEAETRLNQLLSKFKAIALELEGHEHYLYLRAYAAGLEEYLEALYFYEYQTTNKLPFIEDITSRFHFSIESENERKELTLLTPIVEMLLGIGDFTGEMMRKCINNLGSGNLENCFNLCSFVRQIYVGFMGLNWIGHSFISRKYHTLRESLYKMELVCYNIKVRGSEVPKHMLDVGLASYPNLDDDEGYY
ncbi:translin-associated protein X [Onthophagus taurus]|uniref:translin-associated protein X n=1 Tax=Onthophagus taurus TaxID=166361 RepID=UPI0039BE9F35